MDLLKFIVFDILGVTPLLVGFIALIGLLIQRKPIEKVLSGTFKTIVGFLVFAGGAGLAVTSLGNFQTLFSDGFGLKGVMPLAEALTGLAQTKFAMCVSLIMVIGFGWNLLFARITPFKYIFLTGQHNLYLSALLTVTLKALGYSDMTTIIVGSVLLGLAACLYPAIAQPWMRKITGNDEIAMGHYVTLAYAISGWIGSKVGDPKQSTEKLNLPGWLGIFKDYIVSVSISVSIFYYIAALAAGKVAVTAAAGGMHWLVYPLYQSLTFTASLYIIITGVRLLLSEIVPAFLGISEKFIPNAKPALDCPVVFPYAPTATVLGFISSFIGGLVVMGFLAILGQTVIIPVAIPYFFIGATAAVFGNASGGWKGAIVGSFVTGILIGVGPALIYPIMESVGLSGTSFPETDFVALGLVVYYIGKMLP
ncbi:MULTISPECIES: PTS ascorbate transporter subunit IIC [unclassified Pseudocitrobacter]|uniref:PTS ascorbate transporter subunit IIC n=1 Tax=unclassified Pseudocitrobacter TaxID=2638778 RepID=UPI0023E3FB82|nr:MULTISPECIES: PTS ascorbate transporter subunit IIC [unclassified Pseudocitrobacter]MDF3826172.1 PTS transporter subunit IIC [Pseudocitrobacter sp. 2023EL-00150]MEC5371991.1 PTS transporter subunit IIC [Pseudocitrobacter sp. MW920760]